MRVAKPMADAETTAKRYLRQLTEMGYLTAHGGNRNRTYSLGDKYKEWTDRQLERQINNMGKL